MTFLTRPAAAVALLVGLAFACTNTIEGVPLEDDVAGGGTSAGASVVNGGTTGSASGGTTSVAGSASPSGGVGSGTPGVGGTSGDPIGTGGTSTGGTSTGGTSTGGTSTGGTSTGGSGFAGSAQAGSGAGSVGGMPATGGSVTGGTAGSGMAGSAGAAGAPSAFAAVTAVITRTCAATTCHGMRRTPNLSAANLYTNLMNTAVRECGNDRLVTPGDTANSAILQLVNGQCGALIMPEDCNTPPCLSAADQKTISDWIAAGAPR